MAAPVFEYVIVLGDTAKATLRVVSLSGISTRHGDTKTKRGRLFGSVVGAGGSYTLSLYSDPTRLAKVAEGDTDTLGEAFALEQANTSGISGTAIIDAHSADDTGIVLVASFAVDEDVQRAQAEAATLAGGGYDAQYGLAHYQAEAMRRIITSGLPAALPHLFGGIGAAAYVPDSNATAGLPDLRTLASVDHLRTAQAALCKAVVCEGREHIEEFGAILDAAQARYEKEMERLKAANTNEQPAAAAESSGFSVSTFNRG